MQTEKKIFHHDSYGFLASSPAECGTGLRVGCHCKLPNLATKYKEKFKV